LWPDQDARGRLEEAARQLPEHHGRLGHPLDWHVTLVFLGQVGEGQLPCIEEVAAGVSSDAFRMRIDQVGYWKRPRILWCGPSRVPETLLRLVSGLQQGLRQCGFKPESRPYAPHITLARKARPVADYVLQPPVHWEVREFVLAGSHGGARPPRYQVLKRWQLAWANGLTGLYGATRPPYKNGQD
jgi:2'-5' RNA ligase